MPLDQTPVAIDFGSSFFRVSVFKNGRVELLENELGKKVTPSYVAFTDKYPLVGDRAKTQATMNPLNTIYAMKRILGRQRHDLVSLKLYEQWVFKTGSDKTPRLHIQCKGEKQTATLEEAAAIVFAKAKNMAEAYLQEDVKKPVVTVPAQFNSTQRQAIRDAAKIAGLEAILVNESIAAALAYMLEFKKELCSGMKNFLIFDFGGGRTDAAVVTAVDGKLHVRSSVGDMNIGGDDLDWVLMKEFDYQYRITHGKSIRDSPNAFLRLREACEQLKKQLSFSSKTTLTFEGLNGYQDFSKELTRDSFETICGHFFETSMECVDEAVQTSGLRREKIDEVILVGGSSRIPKVQELLSSRFYGKLLNKAINPDETVAIGAAVYSMLTCSPEALQGLGVKIQSPFDIGFEIYKGCMELMITKYSILPAAMFKETEYCASCEAETTFPIEIYEGSSVKTHLNRHLLTFSVPLKPNLDKRLRYKVSLKLNELETLKVRVTDLVTGNTQHTKYSIWKSPYSKEQLEELAFKIKEYKREEIEEFACIEAKYSLESCIQQMRGKLDKVDIPDSAKESIQRKCDKVFKWLGSAPRDSLSMYNAKKDFSRECKTALYGKKTTAPDSSFKTTSSKNCFKPATRIKKITCKPENV